ncbi:MAG: fatty acyl-AMP ligase [Geminicoccaceae bacterium]
MTPTPTNNHDLPLRRADFSSVPEAIDYAAKGASGLNFYSARLELTASLPYALLRERAVQLARGMVQAGLDKGARIVLLGDTDPEIITAFFACQYASLIPVIAPIPASLGGREAYVASLKRLLLNCRAAAAIAPSDYLGFINEAVADLGEVPMVGTPRAFFDLPGNAVDPRPFGPGDPCYLQYSSGSTREPLGVDVPQHCLMANTHGIATVGLDVQPDDRGISWLPLYHDMGLVGFLLTPAFCQRSVDFLATRDFARRPLSWLKLFGDNGGTLAYSPTFGYDLCSRRAEKGTSEQLDLSSWRAAGIGGDMIRPEVMAHFAEVFAPHGFRRTAFVASYGMAEATLAVSFAPLQQGLDVDVIDRRQLADNQRAEPAADDSKIGDRRGFVDCGPPLPGHVVEIRGEDGSQLPDRRVGRVFVKGPSIAIGYFEAPEATAEHFRDGWLDTGDLGYLVDGRLMITGRSNDLMIINGRNIWPQDIEWAIEMLAGIRQGDVAVFSIEDADSEPRVIILVQCRLRDQDERGQLRREVKATATRAAAVDGMVVLVPAHSLPMTASGKLSRTAARRKYLSGTFDDHGISNDAPLPAAASR